MRSPRTPSAASAASPAGPARHRRFRTGWAAAVLGVLSAVLLALVAAGWSPLLDADRSMARRLHAWAVTQPDAVHVNRILSDWVWDPWTMRALAAAVCVALWWRRERVLAVWLAGATLVGTLLQQVLKAAVGRERPSWPDPVDSANLAAFPSGHAMTATVVCGLLLWVAVELGASRRWLRPAVAVAVVSVVGVGLTRLYLGVHWPSDVLGGWLMGACWVLCAITLYERYGAGRERS
ncbi:phosphatase PAP2 family protein [Streptomyces yaizuensis]|uniref:Phosphatase PAP2 family protein n=1 Tax=Streptomyces yaizuensis TaxID=2989713 RepID=A0ABQ5NYP4_9ACTN|nr:phosphatase PAP2 family protein [Streptomyces sp. YSPA8]GLF95347.1 phosphatase PAP2 family protein [Streptomyces sp. YSPA8]